MGGRGALGSSFGDVSISLLGGEHNGKVSPIITAGLMELRGNQADTESTLQNIDRVRFNNLSHEQLFVVDQQGFVLKGYDGGKHSVAIDVASAEKWEGLTVTHRHPSAFGGTFSLADVENCARFGWGKHEASAAEGRYSMHPTRNADGNGLVKALRRALPKIEKSMRMKAIEVGTKQFANKEAYKLASRKAQLQVLHEWYSKNMPQYGYIYEFKEREGINK